MSDVTLFLGVDAGGTHCRSRLADERGMVIGTGEAGPANARIGVDALRLAILDVAGQAMVSAGLDPASLDRVSAGCGIAGISRGGVRAALESMRLPFRAVRFETDAVIANLGAHGGEDGAILIIGTGSIAHARVGDISFNIGGYGFPISDEGSGAALGLSAMRHALRALDGRTRTTPLSVAVAERFGQDTVRAIAWMDGATPRDYASFAPLVMEHAEAGDAIARSIVEDAAVHIERFIETLRERGAPQCALAGGLALRMRPWLRSRTVEQLVEPEGDPLDGALFLAGLRKDGSGRMPS